MYCPRIDRRSTLKVLIFGDATWRVESPRIHFLGRDICYCQLCFGCRLRFLDERGQTALKALNDVFLLLGWYCNMRLKEEALIKDVLLLWLPDYKGISGKEEIDKLAQLPSPNFQFHTQFPKFRTICFWSWI